jgi:hypothetical protein
VTIPMATVVQFWANNNNNNNLFFFVFKLHIVVFQCTSYKETLKEFPKNIFIHIQKVIKN